MTQPKPASSHALENQDPAFHSGATEGETKQTGHVQILPVWASSQPMGYEGSPSDAQAVGGGDSHGLSPAESHAGRLRVTDGGD